MQMQSPVPRLANIQTPRQTPAHAPRRTAINAEALTKLVLMERAIESLDREGHTVIGVDMSVGKPTLQLESSAKLAAMAQDGQAAYYMRGIGANGLPFRKGILPAYRNVNVVWFERGH